MYTDTHCHLYFERFDADREAVLRRATEEGVDRILIPGIDLQTSGMAVDLARRYENLFAAVGVHPNDALSWTDESLDDLRILAKQPKVVAIGEIGLDYYWESAPRDVQKHVFTKQLELAMECELPVVIHVRDRDLVTSPALCDTVTIIREWISGLVEKNSLLAARPGVLHSYSGDLETAREAYDLNFKIGITGPVTFKNSGWLREVVKNMPIQALLTETDAPFLTPHPFRGKRNEPAFVRYVVEEITRLRQDEADSVSVEIARNAQKVFHW
ncbi:MAG: hypothetical protein B6D39_05095 [Anaerolineae bacterium UTCFX2]|nr:TatD family hydrolase [Anaerolineales bacterium]OQY92054.1 MAG: hypothetical protein B6D39_05095 [Anaerolineae bacterium UTCFX2]